MSGINQSSRGSVIELVIIGVLVAGIIGFIGWIFWQNYTSNDTVKKDQQVQKTDVEKEDQSDTSGVSTSSHYVDYRKDKKDATGLVVATLQDISKLDGASQALKDFFAADMKKEFPVYDPSTDSAKNIPTKKYTIDRVYGDYAVGSYENSGAYFIWGPENGTGSITSIVGTQNEAFQCQDLLDASVPVELVDSRCIGADSKGVLGIQKYHLE